MAPKERGAIQIKLHINLDTYIVVIYIKPCIKTLFTTAEYAFISGNTVQTWIWNQIYTTVSRYRKIDYPHYLTDDP